MRLTIVVATVITAISAARLDNTYLPPSSAAYAGGSQGAIGAPYPSSSGGYSPHGGSQPFIPIVSYNNQPNNGDGSYSFSYVTGNGIKAEESGYLKPGVPEGPGEAVHGSYSYTAPDGQQISITYTADENGFVPHGSHLPTPPPIPPEILKSLQLNAADGSAGGGGGGGGGGYPSYPSSGGGGYGGGRPSGAYLPPVGK